MNHNYKEISMDSRKEPDMCLDNEVGVGGRGMSERIGDRNEYFQETYIKRIICI